VSVVLGTRVSPHHGSDAFFLHLSELRFGKEVAWPFEISVDYPQKRKNDSTLDGAIGSNEKPIRNGRWPDSLDKMEIKLRPHATPREQGPLNVEKILTKNNFHQAHFSVDTVSTEQR
jgi:hypothetical protein